MEVLLLPFSHICLLTGARMKTQILVSAHTCATRRCNIWSGRHLVKWVRGIFISQINRHHKILNGWTKSDCVVTVSETNEC